MFEPNFNFWNESNRNIHERNRSLRRELPIVNRRELPIVNRRDLPIRARIDHILESRNDSVSILYKYGDPLRVCVGKNWEDGWFLTHNPDWLENQQFTVKLCSSRRNINVAINWVKVCF